MNQLAPFTDRAPALIKAARARASYRFLEFFESLISTTFEGLNIGPLCPRPAPKALCALLELL